MSKTEIISLEQARATVDRIAQELGLNVADKSGFIKVQGPTSKHRLYIQKSRTMNRIDFTIPLAKDDPMYKEMKSPNGSIVCHVEPSLENLEKALRMLADAAHGVQVPNKPRPFAATKEQVRRPKAVAAPVPEEALATEPADIEKAELQTRLANIKARARLARINRILENHKGVTESEAEQIVDGKITLDEVINSNAAAISVEVQDVLAEAGVEVER